VNVKAFFVDTLGSALELELATPDDVLRYVTPDVLATHLPRPLWARLLIACLGAPRVDAPLVLETIGVANLCEHVPAHILWSCIFEIGDRALGGVISLTKPVTRPTPQTQPLMSPPPQVSPTPPMGVPARAPVAAPGRPIPTPVNQPLADLIEELDTDDRAATASKQPQRSPTQPRFRPAQTGIGRGTPPSSTQRRPQAAAPPTPAATARPLVRRGSTEVNSEVEVDTEIGRDGWSKDTAVAVDDSQLVDWSPTDTVSGDDGKR
jgi:hypothetical protein